MVYYLANDRLSPIFNKSHISIVPSPPLMLLPHPNKNMTRTGEKHTVPTNESHTFPQVQ